MVRRAMRQRLLPGCTTTIASPNMSSSGRARISGVSNSGEYHAGGIDLIDPERVAAGFDILLGGNFPLARLVALDGPHMLVVDIEVQIRFGIGLPLERQVSILAVIQGFNSE